MPITTYASVAQFFGPGGAPSTVMGALTTTDVQTALVAASALMDDHFRGVVPLPLLDVSASVSQNCVYIARYLFLDQRGFSPVAGSDERVVKDREEAMAWLDKVQRRVLFPFRQADIDPTASIPTNLTPGGSAQPTVLSQPSRGWSPTVGYGGFPYPRCGGFS